MKRATQQRALWGLVGRLAAAMGTDRAEAEELMRDWCEADHGTRSTRDLSDAQLSSLVGRVERAVRGGVPMSRSAPTTTPAPVATTPTPDQLDVLSKLFAQAGYASPASRQGFARRQCGKPWPQSQADVTAIMRALTAIVQRGADVGEVRAQIARLSALPNLTGWERDVFLPDLTRQATKATWKPRPHQLVKLDEIEAKRAITASVA